jgi:membrane protein required for colicin V production
MDVIFVGLIGLFMIRCYVRGFISELLSMAAIVLGLLTSLFFYKNGAEFLRKHFWHELNIVPEVAAFILLFIIVFIVVKLLERMLKEIIERVSLGGADRFIGVIFGLAEGIAVVSLILFLLRIQPLFNPEELLSDSFFAHILLPLITGKESV